VTSPISGLPIVPDTALPADVRKGSARDKQTYQAALSFERELLGQLMQSMTDTTQPADDSSDSGSDSDFSSSDAATSAYRQMLPGQLTDATIAGGGTGLADSLYRALREGQS
jgi:Rod binding domain-containing protein